VTTTKSKPRTIELEVHIDAPREAVWTALTEPSELARWFPPIATGKAGLGEELLLSWGPEVQWRTFIVAWEPGKHLLWQDKATPSAPRAEGSESPGALPPAPTPMAVDWTLEASGRQVRVRLVQSGFGEGDAWDDFYDGTDFGWRFYIHALRHYLTHHRGQERAMVSARRLVSTGRADAWQHLFSPAGLAAKPSLAQWKPGQPFEVQWGLERLAGKLDFVRTNSGFWGTMPDLADATLLVEMEPGPKDFHCGIWLSTYGLPAERVKALQAGLTQTADRTFSKAG
jgi:uncharacterized protein YndB with AHSA1/START domain